MATLDERFRAGPPTRGPGERHAWLSAEEKRFVLWALREQWSAARAGRALGVHEATVRRFRNAFRAEPRLLLELNLHEATGRAESDAFRCLVCRSPARGMVAIERHVLRHFLEQDLVDTAVPPDTTTPTESRAASSRRGKGR